MTPLTPGDVVTLEVGPVAHGGHCVARHDGRVLFVRHALPGEQVRALVTEGKEGDRFLRADAIEVLSASPDRVTPPCRYAGPGQCGGCDFQHVSIAAQRDLKAQVIAEQFRRLARIDVDVTVEAVPGDQQGLRWRTRTEFPVNEAGEAGMRPHRSHEILPVADCLIAQVPVAAALQSRYAGCDAVDVVAPSLGEPVQVPLHEHRPVSTPVPEITEHVAAQRLQADFTVSARGFWQVHPGAPATLVDAALELLAPQPGETVLDLYSGVGVFSAALGQAVGERGRVIAVESDAQAVRDAQRNLAAYPWAVAVAARVDDFFGVPRPKRKGPGTRRVSKRPTRDPLAPPRADRVLLDPPRTGAGREVLGAVAAVDPEAIVYVACDPAALARDSAYLAELGYRLSAIRAFDAFPMTHHVECVALLRKQGQLS